MRRNLTIIPRYLDILAWRREGKTFQWIAAQLGISRQRAWEIHQRALRRIENNMARGNRQDKQKQAA